MKKMYTKNWVELKPNIDGRKSFYKKAHYAYVYDDDGLCGIVLKSYDTNVCFISSYGTMRHVHDFIYQFGGKISGGKKEWEQMPTYDDYMFIESV